MIDEIKLKALEVSMDIARLPRYNSISNNGVGYSTPMTDAIDVILTRAAMIEAYLLGTK